MASSHLRRLLPATKPHLLTHLRRYGPPRPHDHSTPSSHLGSWEPSPALVDPWDAQRRLDLLRKDYARKVREFRKKYEFEVETEKVKKLRKEATRREAVRVAKEERKAAKKEADEARAAKHKAFQEELRQTLSKERAEKLESWRTKEAAREKKKSEARELLRKQSSLWIDEGNLKKKIFECFLEFSRFQ